MLGLVGESGSGKTTLGRTLLGLVQATGGNVHLEGREITGLNERDLRPLRKRMQIVFQDPHASLNPAMTIGTSVGDPLRFHGIAKDSAERERLVAAALERVGLAPAAQFATSTRPTCPAARSSARCSPGRSSSAPTCWSPTSRSRCST